MFDKGYAYDMRRPDFLKFNWAEKRKMVEAYTIALKEKAAVRPFSSLPLVIDA